MRTKFSGILTLFLAFIVQITFAQEKTISGTVTDDSGLPLPGVNIIVKNTTNGTQTDFDGNYSIQANRGAVLSFSYVGFAGREIVVDENNEINVKLSEDLAQLETVVVTALGLKKKKDDDLTSSTTVDTEMITKSAESGVIQGLAGKTSGLKITKNSGDPGSGAFILIRGQNSINGASEPLIILDGVPISNSNVNITATTSGVSEQSRLNDISAEDIENVTVLKGASAAAVWGTGAANGVIVITTKKGRIGSAKKVSVNVKASVIIDEVNKEFEKQGIFGQGTPVGVGVDDGVFQNNSAFSWGDRIALRSGEANGVDLGNERFESISGNVIYPILQKNDNQVYNDTNRDQVFGTGYTFEKAVDVSFSGPNSSTYVSFSDWDQDGIIQGRSTYRRQTLRLNQTTDLTDKLRIKFGSSYSKIKSERIQQGSNVNGLYLGYLRTSPDFDNRDYKGTYYDANNVPTQNAHRSYRNYLGSAAPAYNNPGWTINEQSNPNGVERFNLSPELVYKVNDNLSFTGRYGLDYYTDHRETYFPVNSASSFALGSFRQDDVQEKTENINVFLQYNKMVSDNFNYGVILGASADRNQYSRLTATSAQFTNPALGDLRLFGNATAENEVPERFVSETRKSGVYSVLNAEFFNQLLIELSGRYERPSTLTDNIFYPAASLGWKFSELINGDSFLSFGKVRLAYGEVGIEPNPYLAADTFSPGGILTGFGDELLASVYGNPFQSNNAIGNPNLKEERIKEYEIGTDLRFFQNRITLGATYYDRTTEDVILLLDVPSSTGSSSVYDNAAEISNKGVELDLSLKLVSNTNFEWSINANFAKNENIVESLSGTQSVFLNGFAGASSRAVEGYALGALWGVGFERDDNDNFVLDANGFPVVSTEESVLGDPNPDWTGGIGTNISYKGITLSAQLETSQGNDHWQGTKGVLNYFGISPETANISVSNQDLTTYSGGVIPAGTEFRGNIQDFGNGPVALDIDWYTTNGGGFGAQSESFITDASWTRLRELSLGYDFPSRFIEQAGFSNFSITLTGRNLFLWTEIDGFDPDINLTGASRGRGLDYFTNPSTKSYAFTLRLGF
ncbi:SusC/RagA family TonB-linked outer membrane protein [Aquimarina sp. W85]|uniref:SusC/RagA family TonB-linked outer membrane protein n=1 Tax=Aquimarina rhodophyticola TaxID=3342246 RepID=UPI00366D46E9